VLLLVDSSAGGIVTEQQEDDGIDLAIQTLPMGNDRVGIANIPAAPGVATFDLVIETRLACEGGKPITQFRMRGAIVYGGI